MHELKKCPLDGKEALIGIILLNGSECEVRYNVFCKNTVNCGCRTAMFRSKDEAVAAWNRRVEE